jgi:hypothetical protein
MSFQVLALERLPVYQLSIWSFDNLNTAVLPTLQENGLDNSSLSRKLGGLGIMPLGVLVTNPPIGHLILRF